MMSKGFLPYAITRNTLLALIWKVSLRIVFRVVASFSIRMIAPHLAASSLLLVLLGCVTLTGKTLSENGTVSGEQVTVNGTVTRYEVSK